MSRKPTGAPLSTPSVPRKSRSPSALTVPWRSGISSAVATAFSVTPAQATSASSSMSPEHSSAPEPPVAGCSPATASARPVSTLQAMCWSSSVPWALSVMTAAKGSDRYWSLSGAWRVRSAAASIFLPFTFNRLTTTARRLRGHAAGGGLEGRRELVARARQAKRLLVEDAPGLWLHDDGAVGKGHRLLDVVGDEEHGRAVLLPQREQMLVQARPGKGVERRERLVEEEHLRLGHEG